MCQEKHIVAHSLKRRHAIGVTQAVPCAPVRGLSLTFNGHLSRSVRRRQKQVDKDAGLSRNRSSTCT